MKNIANIKDTTTYIITEECINCSACFYECPEKAILKGGTERLYKKIRQKPISADHYFIAPEICNGCAGEEEVLCIEICPMDCIDKI